MKKLKNNKGAILIEFAFAIPILIIVLFFMLDVPMAYRISTKLQKTSELFAEMILNINRHKESRGIAKTDLENISKIIGLVFTGVTKNKSYPFFLSTYLICVRGTGENAFEKLWNMHITNDLVKGEVTSSIDSKYSSIQDGSQFLGNIKDLEIQKNEIKLIVETVIWYKDDSRGFNSKFHILTIPGTHKEGIKTFGDKNAIVTPPYGLVTEDAPE